MTQQSILNSEASQSPIGFEAEDSPYLQPVVRASRTPACNDCITNRKYNTPGVYPIANDKLALICGACIVPIPCSWLTSAHGCCPKLCMLIWAAPTIRVHGTLRHVHHCCFCPRRDSPTSFAFSLLTNLKVLGIAAV